MSIAEQLSKVKSTLKPGVELVAVSKTKPIEAIQEAYDSGQRIFGENKAQELQQKAESLAEDIQWHMIGHLQRNKVKYIAPHVALIHSVDSLRLLKEIDKRAIQQNRCIDVLLQVYIAKEESKFGLNDQELAELLNHPEYKGLQHIRVCGLMGMASNVQDQAIVQAEFSYLSKLFNRIKTDFFPNQPSFDTLSMGMSGDYEIAMEEGANLVRIGSSIFGARNYSN